MKIVTANVRTPSRRAPCAWRAMTQERADRHVVVQRFLTIFKEKSMSMSMFREVEDSEESDGECTNAKQCALCLELAKVMERERADRHVVVQRMLLLLKERSTRMSMFREVEE